MITKHFFKTLLVFMGMIAIGLLGVFLVSHFDKTSNQVNVTDKDCTQGQC